MVIFGGFGEGSKMGVFGHFGGVRGGGGGRRDGGQVQGLRPDPKSQESPTKNSKGESEVVEEID